MRPSRLPQVLCISGVVNEANPLTMYSRPRLWKAMISDLFITTSIDSKARLVACSSDLSKPGGMMTSGFYSLAGLSATLDARPASASECRPPRHLLLAAEGATESDHIPKNNPPEIGVVGLSVPVVDQTVRKLVSLAASV